MAYHSFLEAIGNTPAVELRALNPVAGTYIYGKLEFYNPTGSLKDRIVKFMVERAEERGELRPGMTIVEATSGNTGIALAAVAAYRGYRALIVMAENMSVERRRIMQAFGAQLVLTPAAEGPDRAIAEAEEIAQSPDHYLLGQFTNEDNVLAHYETTARAILEQVPELDTFVAGMGTGGTVTGVARRLKEVSSAIKVVGIEVSAGSRIQGLKCFDGYVPPVVDFQNNVVHDTEIFVNETDLFDRPYGQRYGKLCWLFLEPVLALERAWRDERVHVRKVN